MDNPNRAIEILKDIQEIKARIANGQQVWFPALWVPSKVRNDGRQYYRKGLVGDGWQGWQETTCKHVKSLVWSPTWL